MPGLIYFSTKDGAVATTLEEWRGWGRKEGGEERRKRVALAPRARWISIMLNRKWSPAIECLSAPPLEAHKAGGIRLLRCNVTEKLNSLVLSATAFSRPIVRFLPFPSLSPPSPPFCSLLPPQRVPPPHLSGTPRAKTTVLGLSRNRCFPFLSLERRRPGKIKTNSSKSDGYRRL